MFKKPAKINVTILVPALIFIFLSLTVLQFFSACSANQPKHEGLPKVLAIESFLADITKNISGSRLVVETLIPLGLDPHSFEPSPGDVAKISESDILVINGSGFEGWLNKIITGANEKVTIIECSKGLKNRIQNGDVQEQSSNEISRETGAANESGLEAETVIESGQEAYGENETGYLNEGDPHFWLDPNLAMVYVQNIKDALIKSDPQGKELYDKNAEEYTARLMELDAWITKEVKKIPQDKRLLVTNHESFGYYADRYGFKVIGTIIPNFSSASSPSAKEVSDLIDRIRATNVRAIFLETGSDSKIADQIAKETGIKVVTELFTHSITEPAGPAPTYIKMIEFDTNTIVESLK
jgi:ABC-type Zn uptake system ZnuABC Zn-binding protein ZnuA